MNTVELLKELGLNKASEKVEKTGLLKNKLMVAYEHFRVVDPKIVERFQVELRKKTEKKNKTNGYTTYDKLVFIPLKDYSEVPPQHALESLAHAKQFKAGGVVLFDEFEVAKIETITERPDPIIFGRIDGSPDRFFVCQWDDDVKIEDILRENEG